MPLVTNFPGICAFIIGFSSTVWTKKSAKTIRKQVSECLQNLYQSVAIHLKYTLVMSTKVFSLIIICKSLWQNDPLPRNCRLHT